MLHPGNDYELIVGSFVLISANDEGDATSPDRYRDVGVIPVDNLSRRVEPYRVILDDNLRLGDLRATGRSAATSKRGSAGEVEWAAWCACRSSMSSAVLQER